MKLELHRCGWHFIVSVRIVNSRHHDTCHGTRRDICNIFSHPRKVAVCPCKSLDRVDRNDNRCRICIHHRQVPSNRPPYIAMNKFHSSILKNWNVQVNQTQRQPAMTLDRIWMTHIARKNADEIYRKNSSFDLWQTLYNHCPTLPCLFLLWSRVMGVIWGGWGPSPPPGKKKKERKKEKEREQKEIKKEGNYE